MWTIVLYEGNYQNFIETYYFMTIDFYSNLADFMTDPFFTLSSWFLCHMFEPFTMSCFGNNFSFWEINLIFRRNNQDKRLGTFSANVYWEIVYVVCFLLLMVCIVAVFILDSNLVFGISNAPRGALSSDRAFFNNNISIYTFFDVKFVLFEIS